MGECRALAAWAETLPISAPPASDNFIVNRMEFMDATLPSRNVADATGEKRTAVYVKVLRGHSREALAFMADRAIRALKWFPLPAECLSILDEYQPDETERSATLRLCAAFADVAFDQWLANIRDGQPIGDVPEAWCRIAVERGVVRRLDDGSYVSRARFIGPTLEGKVMPWLSRGTWHSEVNKDRNGCEENGVIALDNVAP